MSGLVLRLAPNERVLINGVVIENGSRSNKIAIKTPNANVLRLRDAIHPDSVRTPVTRACYTAQLIITGDIDAEKGRDQLLTEIEQLIHVFIDPDSRRLLTEAGANVDSGNIYGAMRRLNTLLPREARLLAVS